LKRYRLMGEILTYHERPLSDTLLV